MIARHPSRRLLAPVLMLAGILVTSPSTLVQASGSSGGGSSSSDSPAIPESQQMSPEEQAAAARQAAMETYDKNYELTLKAADAMDEARQRKAQGPEEAKKAEELRAQALKHYKKAIDGFRKAVKLDPGYHEAWNMLGYSYRKTGQMGEAFKAYETCLKLKPDYDLAHEYLGEAWLQAGDIDKARAELAWLTEQKSPEAPKLAAAIGKVAAGETAFLGTDW
ncbi:MAG TPA: tetratricopeptide repeat protein [Candidatus Eisenbacteria bacterium]